MEFLLELFGIEQTNDIVQKSALQLDDISQLVNNYIEKRDTDYAILINGKWGIGKTYYLKKTLFSVIERMKFNSIGNKEQSPKYYRPIYISLYGINSLDQLQNKVLLGIYPFWDTMAGKIIASGGELVSNVVLKKFADSKIDGASIRGVLSNGSLPSRFVFFFDDLERLDSEILLTVLGYINSISEHNFIKVILIGNEAEIGSPLKPEILLNYHKIKEKLIRYTVEYAPDIEILFNEITDCSDEHEKRIVLTNLNQSDHNNLRTIKFIWDNWEIVKDYIIKLNIPNEFFGEIINRALFFLVCYSIELKKIGNKDQIVDSIRDLNEFDLNAFNFNNFLEEQEIPNDPKSNKDIFKEEFKDRYLISSDITFTYFKSIRNLLVNGVLYEPDFAKEINNLLDKLRGYKEKPEMQQLQKLNNYFELEDDELEGVISEILVEVEKGSYQLIEYPNIYIRIMNFTKFINSDSLLSGIKEKFLKGMELSKLISIYSDMFKFQLPEVSNPTPEYIEIKTKAIKLNEDLNNTSTRDEANAFLSRLKDADNKDLIDCVNLLTTDNKYLFMPVFAHIDPQMLFQLILTKSNFFKKQMVDLFRRRYNYEGSNPSFDQERENLQTLENLTSQFIVNTTENKISTDLMQVIDTNLKKALSKPKYVQ